jgi:hypothetical protein
MIKKGIVLAKVAHDKKKLVKKSREENKIRKVA